MDRDTCRIIEPEVVGEFKRRFGHLPRTVMQMAIPPSMIQRAQMRVGRNDPCPCGSGKKFKRCCQIEILLREAAIGRPSRQGDSGAPNNASLRPDEGSPLPSRNDGPVNVSRSTDAEA